jgi:hypothetical protein
MPPVTAYSQVLEGTIMDDIDFIEEQEEDTSRAAAEEAMRLKVAFGDDVAQRFLRLRGIVGELMQEAVLERYAAKQAARMARDVIAAAALVNGQ